MVQVRKDVLAVGEIYHVFTRSIAGFKVFSADAEFRRIIQTMRFYQKENPPLRFCRFIKMKDAEKEISDAVERWSNRDKLVRIYAYCIMPTHIHVLLKQLKVNGTSIFMSNVLNSYARYFNTKLKRKGPLWEGNFKNALVRTDEQLIHLTRYIHLNPVTAYLANMAEEWSASSYKEYLGEIQPEDRICECENVLEVEPNAYREFVNDNISYQRELATIKKLILD